MSFRNIVQAKKVINSAIVIAASALVGLVAWDTVQHQFNKSRTEIFKKAVGLSNLSRFQKTPTVNGNIVSAKHHDHTATHLVRPVEGKLGFEELPKELQEHTLTEENTADHQTRHVKVTYTDKHIPEVCESVSVWAMLGFAHHYIETCLDQKGNVTQKYDRESVFGNAHLEGSAPEHRDSLFNYAFVAHTAYDGAMDTYRAQKAYDIARSTFTKQFDNNSDIVTAMRDGLITPVAPEKIQRNGSAAEVTVYGNMNASFVVSIKYPKTVLVASVNQAGWGELEVDAVDYSGAFAKDTYFKYSKSNEGEHLGLTFSPADPAESLFVVSGVGKDHSDMFYGKTAARYDGTLTRAYLPDNRGEPYIVETIRSSKNSWLKRPKMNDFIKDQIKAAMNLTSVNVKPTSDLYDLVVNEFQNEDGRIIKKRIPNFVVESFRDAGGFRPEGAKELSSVAPAVLSKQ